MDNAKVAEKAAEVVEEVLDATEETVETLERIPKAHLNGVTRQQAVTILVVTALGGAAVGGTVTYLVTKKRLRTYYNEIAEREIAEARADYEARTATREKPSLEDVAKEAGLGDRVRDLGYSSTSSHPALQDDAAVPDEQAVLEEGVELGKSLEAQEADREVMNVFSAHGDFIWDQAQEESKRRANPGEPYVISVEEYMQNTPEHEQDLLTYFEGDDVLVDAQDVPIPDMDGAVGEGNLTRFGHGTRDAHVVHIRNERLDMDFEIHRSRGKYVVEVLGNEDPDELRHSDRRRGGGRPRRSRELDE